MSQAKIKIQNLVLSVVFEGTEFNLEKMVRALDGARYDPEIFPGVSFRYEEPRASFLIFASGKMNCVGAKSMRDAKLAIKKLTRELRESGFEIKSEPKIRLRNIVASIDFGRGFDLDEIARKFENIEYEPEVFPGLVIRFNDPKVVVLLFAGGKGVCAGAKSKRDIEWAVEHVVKMRLPRGRSST